MSAEFTIPGERKEPPQIVFRAPGKAGQRINMWCIFVGAKADYEELQLLAPGSPFAGNLMPFPPTVDRLSDRPSALTRAGRTATRIDSAGMTGEKRETTQQQKE